MKNKRSLSIGLFFLIFWAGIAQNQEKDLRFLSFAADPSSIKFYWKDDNGKIFRSIQNLKQFVETKN